MKTKLLKMARRLWNNDIVPKEINRINQIKWAKSVILLGDRWLLAKYIDKLH